MSGVVKTVLVIIVIGALAWLGWYVYHERHEEKVASGMHPSWDVDGDGINDCEMDGTCDDSVDYTQPRPASGMHPSWDMDGDGINDCESDGTCDDSVDYSKPRPSMHPSWDVNGDGINDCEDDGTCDHTIDYTQPRDSASGQMGDPALLSRLQTHAVIELPEADGLISLMGATTDTDEGEISFGAIAMPYPYESESDKGSDAITTIDVEGTVYLVAFTPGEAGWEMVSIVEIGDAVAVEDVKVVGEVITVGYVEDGMTVEETMSFTLEGGEFVEEE